MSENKHVALDLSSMNWAWDRVVKKSAQSACKTLSNSPREVRQREGPPEYSGKMLGSSIQGIQAEYSVGSENKHFSIK